MRKIDYFIKNTFSLFRWTTTFTIKLVSFIKFILNNLIYFIITYILYLFFSNWWLEVIKELINGLT